VTATIHPDFAPFLLRTFDDPNEYGVHLLFNQFWQHAPREVIDKYAAQFAADDRLRRFVEERHYAEPLTLERLATCPTDSLGAAVHRFIVENGLEKNLGTNYHEFHRMLEASGMLDNMPEGLRYAVLRGFQLHDLLHVITGYAPTPGGEIALQAFCLAQLQFPYFAMWISVVTTRMAFIDPDPIVPLMDQITQGWQFGRTVDSIQIDRWEERLDEPLSELRVSCGIHPAGRRPLAPSADAPTASSVVVGPI
jgi:ubiquinone biosynthesis protein COQ4